MIITIISGAIIILCIVFTVINSKNHPERYQNEKSSNALGILFGDMIGKNKDIRHKIKITGDNLSVDIETDNNDSQSDKPKAKNGG